MRHMIKKKGKVTRKRKKYKRRVIATGKGKKKKRREIRFLYKLSRTVHKTRLYNLVNSL